MKFTSRPPKHCACERCWPPNYECKYSKRKYWECRDKQWRRIAKELKKVDYEDNT